MQHNGAVIGGGLGRCCSMGSIPGPGMCHRCNRGGGELTAMEEAVEAVDR